MFEQQRGSPQVVQVNHRSLAAGGKVGQDRCRLEDFLDVRQFERNGRLPGQGQHVENTVGRAACGSNGHSSVRKGISGKDVSRPQITGQQPSHQWPNRQALLPFLGSLSWNRTAVRGHQADRFHGDSPCVERGCNATPPRTWASCTQDLIRLLLGHCPHARSSLRIVNIQDGHVTTVVTPRPNASAAHQQSRVIQAGQCHGKPRSVLVAVVKTNHGIVPVGRDHTFSGVGDHVSRRETAIAPFMTLRDVVTNGRSSERETNQANFLAAFGQLAGKFVGVQITQIPV